MKCKCSDTHEVQPFTTQIVKVRAGKDETLPTFQDVQDELRHLQAINSIIFDPAAVQSRAPVSNLPFEGQAETRELRKNLEKLKDKNKRNEIIRAALQSSAARTKHPSFESVIRNQGRPPVFGHMGSSRSMFGAMKDKSIRPHSSRERMGGLHSPPRPVSARPIENLDLGLGTGDSTDCIVPLSPRNRNLEQGSPRSKSLSPDKNGPLTSQIFRTQPSSPRVFSPRQTRNSFQIGVYDGPKLEEKVGLQQEDRRQRPVTASTTRSSQNTPAAKQTRPHTANPKSKQKPPSITQSSGLSIADLEQPQDPGSSAILQ
jgi:hypothetical protein